MINTIKVWSKNGEAIATFQSTHLENVVANISENHIRSFIIDTNRMNGSVMHYGETLVISVNEKEMDMVLNKLKEMFHGYKQTIL
jgi:hypothetical protein